MNGKPVRYDLTPLRIVVREHVRDRARERLGLELTHDEIRQEVFDGIYRGRWQREKPHWLASHPGSHKQGAIYVWTEDLERAYVVLMGGPRS